jgi:formate dehydrogenase major subunit
MGGFKMKIKINGKEFILDDQVDKTLYQFLKELGIYVPVLCYNDNLREVGMCRLCVVKDRNRIRSSCIAKLEDGMDIIVDDQDLENYRKWALQFLFGERNHYCMYCAKTSQCEFQDLGYYTKLDHFFFPTFYNKYELDTSHDYILFDNNRCVLCNRCVRVCSEVAGHFVLNTEKRGGNTLIVANGGKKLGESNCTSCGLCVQVCPTGTFLDKNTLFLDRKAIEIKTNCFICPIGCSISIFLNQNKDYIAKVYSDFEGYTQGLICYKARYINAFDYNSYLKLNNQFLSLNDIFNIIKKKIDGSIILIDGTLTNEELILISNLNNKYIYYDLTEDLLNNPSLEELDNFDNYVIFDIDLDKEFGALGSILKRNVLIKNKKLFSFNVFNKVYLDISFKVLREYNELNEVSKKHFNNNTLFIVPINLYLKDYSYFANFSNYRFLILPVNSNDIGLIKILKNVPNIANLKNYVDFSDKNIILVSRELKNLKDLNLLNNMDNEKIIITFANNENLNIIKNFKNVKLVFNIGHYFEISGSFWNMFNYEVKLNSIRYELINSK